MAENLYNAMTARGPAKAAAPSAALPVKWWKYTISVPPEVRASITEDVMRLAQATGLSAVDRRHVTLALYRLLHEDESLFAEVARRMPQLVAELENRRDG